MLHAERIVDDDKLVRETVRILLSAKGYEVVLAESGKAGIELARSRSFDLAIIDLFMPGTDGLQVIGAAMSERKYQMIMWLFSAAACAGMIAMVYWHL